MAKARKPKRQRYGGPFLDAALICEDCVQEKDWAISPIRAVNRITVHDIHPTQGELILLPLVLVLSFKAGEVTDKRKLSLYGLSPSGERRKLPGIPEHEIEFRGEDTGAVVVIQLPLQYDRDGTY